MLPATVLNQAARELSGATDASPAPLPALEWSHRGSAFGMVLEQLEEALRALLGIARNYRILFVQGGASAQFAMVPLNLLPSHASADYLHTGYWSGRALAEAQRLGAAGLGQARLAADGSPDRFTCIPPRARWQPDADAAYLYYTENETVQGVEFPQLPESGTVPLVADMTSNFLSRPVPIERFALLFAGAQKNLGPPGLTVVVVREDLIGRAAPGTPSLCDYQVLEASRSLYNTPPTFCWYVALLFVQWLREQGGVERIAARNQRKANSLYQAIDASGLYRNEVCPCCRSRMNVTFRLQAESLTPLFLDQAERAALYGLGGHRSCGGLRASLYNAVSEQDVKVLVEFMREFERCYG